MKAIRAEQFGGPEVLRLQEVPVLQPGDGQILVRLHAIGVNPVDTYIRAGTYPVKPALPYTPGADGAGVVQAVGADVKYIKAGERVYTAGTISGSYAEFALCDAAQVHPLPSNVTFQQGAALGVPYATAFRGLIQRAGAKAGDMVLIHGASGGVGTAAVQIGYAHGAQIFGTASTEAGRQQVKDQGAHHVFDHSAPDYTDKIMQATGGRGLDVILEMQANRNLGKDLKMLAKGGRVVVIGGRGPAEIEPRDAMQRDADIRAMTLFNASPTELAEIHRALIVGLEKGTLRPVVGKELPLAEAARAHREIMEPGATGKLVLIP